MGLKGQDTNYIAQIISISDVYDAMTANRCYRKGLCPFKLIETFETEGFDKYHPRYLLVFLEHIADSYLHNNVLLSDGRRGEIIFIPPAKAVTSGDKAGGRHIFGT